MLTRATFALVTFAAAVAIADSRVIEADRLFQEGRRLVAAGRIADGCAAFDKSQQTAPATTTLFNQADCREKNRQLATAWRLFVEGERSTQAATDDVGKRLHKVAVERAATLAPRLSRITIAVANPTDGLIVMRGADVVPAAEWNRPQPIDGGKYELVAKLGDREIWRETLTIAIEGANEIVHVRPAQADPVTSAKTSVAPTPPVASVPRDAPAPVTSTRSRGPAILATAGTVVLLGGALGFELWGSRIYDDAVADNDESLRNKANTRRYIAQGLLGAGIVSAGVATWLWVRGGSEKRVARTQVRPVAGPSVVGLQLDRSW